MKLLVLAIISCSWVEAFSPKLLLAQAVWRHGDRSPTKTYPSDPYQEDFWWFGGTGWGQLSPIGMTMHMYLGRKLRERYVTKTQLLSQYYNSHEIYIRSTDVNRTIISAISNIIGMYGQPDDPKRSNVDLPPKPDQAADPVWPSGFVPVAIHTVDDDTDYIGNPDAECPRQTKLWAMAKSSKELVDFQNSPAVTQLLKNLTQECGEVVDIDNLWIIVDALFIERNYINITEMQRTVPWYSDEYYEQMKAINDQVELYQNGVFNQSIFMNGLDIGVELQKIRGGSLVNDILMHMNLKLQCQNDTSPDCKWAKNNKYYAYSAHDTTVYAFFSCLGIQSKAVQPHGYPLYSAATLVELYVDTDNNNTAYFKLLYRNATVYQTSEFEDITSDIVNCQNSTYPGFCRLSVFADYAKIVKPDQPMAQWCLVDPTQSAASASLLLVFLYSTILQNF